MNSPVKFWPIRVQKLHVEHRGTNVYSHTFYLVWEPKRKLIAHQCCNQLTAIKTRYPLTSITWLYRGLKFRPIEVEYFLKLTADKLPVSNDHWFKFIFSNDSYQICCVGPALLGFWFQTDLGRENSASFFKNRRGRPFLTMVTRWSRSKSNFYALIGQNLTDELMRKIYAASWKLFTLTAEDDSWIYLYYLSVLTFGFRLVRFLRL